MRLLFFLLSAALLAGCGQVNPPLKIYFVGSTRFTAGNRTAGAADTLAARLYLDDTRAGAPGLTRLRVTVQYTPRREPFIYPTPLSSFLLSSVTPATEELVYLDSTLANPKDLLYTAIFGTRTSPGSERWTFTGTDLDGNSAARAFVISQRRADSTAVYDSYILRLNLPATGAGARRFLDLKSGLALPGYTAAKNPEVQKLIDVILLNSGAIASPDALADSYFRAGTWYAQQAKRRQTKFYLTSLIPTAVTGTPANTRTFANITDTLGIRQQFVPPGVGLVPGLSVGQVYAFRVQPSTAGRPAQYGLFSVTSISGGYQLEVHINKQPL